MDIQKLTKFFMWCTIINGVLLILTILGALLCSEWGASIQSQMFNVPQETVYVAFYFFLGVFKIFWLVFNLVPYLALLIVAKK